MYVEMNRKHVEVLHEGGGNSGGKELLGTMM
jgi:hypothetical protein